MKLERQESFGWLIAVLGQELASGLDSRLRSMGLDLTYWPTLFALWEEEGITQTELSQRCGTAKYTTTRVLDSLESLGLVERRLDPASRRSRLVYLTENGRAIEAEATQQARECNEEFLDYLSEEEGYHLISLVKKLISAKRPELMG